MVAPSPSYPTSYPRPKERPRFTVGLFLGGTLMRDLAVQAEEGARLGRIGGLHAGGPPAGPHALLKWDLHALL